MKKISLAIMLLVFAVSGVFSQNVSTDSSTTITSVVQRDITLKTYKSNYCYFKRMENKPVYVGYDDILGKSVYSSPSRFCEKYANWTPGQLIAQSGKLKNTALTVGIVTGLASATLIGCSFVTDLPMAMYIPGAVVGFAGGVATIALLYTSNRLLQEAGLKMQNVQFSANGVTVKF